MNYHRCLCENSLYAMAYCDKINNISQPSAVRVYFAAAHTTIFSKGVFSMNKNTISSNARSLIGIAVMAVLSLAVIAVSDPLYKALRGPVTTASPEAPLADGIYTYEAPEPDSNGFRDRTTLTVSDGIIVSCVWDSFDIDGKSKQKLSMEGQYIMTPDGPVWKAQSDSVCRYLIEHQRLAGLAGDDGYTTDAVASVSINVYPFINGVEECLRQAEIK
jgi:major membrane immunogen (membrane-anchored lipoprotein)